ncbi:MAG: hypothetical protein IPF64_16290 [Flavobacteriales bacterium]|nr:hypothetical protein [Flavobacteriales bacterium]
MAGTQDIVHHELSKHFKAEETGHMAALGRCHENSAFNIGGLNFYRRGDASRGRTSTRLVNGGKAKRTESTTSAPPWRSRS